MRVYDIILSCGCMISLDKGGGLIGCYDDKNCKYEEEFLKHSKYKEWMRELKRRNN